MCKAFQAQGIEGISQVRKQRIALLQETLGFPRTVGLDLSADRIDMNQPLPALLVAEVDSLAVPELALEQHQTRYLCLSSDNRHALSSIEFAARFYQLQN